MIFAAVSDGIVYIMKILRITESLLLRQLQDVDAVEIFSALDSQREYFRQWLPFVDYTRSVEDSRIFVRSVTEGSELVFSIRLNGVFIGLIGFKETDIHGRHTEIGYWLKEEFQGHGYMTAATDRLVRFAMDEQGIGEVFIKCAVGNGRSRRIPLRLGFEFRHIERNGEQLSDGSFRDVEVFSVRRNK